MSDKFSDSEENKVQYTELFLEYTEIIEKALDEELTSKIPVRFWSMTDTSCIESYSFLKILEFNL